MLNDDLDILDAFSPFIGYGTTSREIRLAQKAARVARNAVVEKKLKKKNSQKAGVPLPEEEEEESVVESKEGKHEYDFGLLNVGIILIAVRVFAFLS